MGGAEQVLQYRRPSPTVSRGNPVTSIYVDNFLCFAGSLEDAVGGAKRFLAQCRRRDVDITEDDLGVLDFEGLGLLLSGKTRLLRHKGSRLWRFYRATGRMLRLHRWRGDQMSVWIGHATCIAALFTPLLSILQEVYKFNEDNRGTSSVPCAALRWELRAFADLCFFAQVQLDADFDHEVYCGDASSFGYALMSTEGSPSEIHHAAKYREKWRFQKVDDQIELPLASSVSDALAGLSVPGAQESDHLVNDSRVRGAHCQPLATASTPFALWLEAQAHEGRLAHPSLSPEQRVARPNRGQLLDLEFLVPPLDLHWDLRERWHTIIEKLWLYQSEHINIKEARVILLALRRCCRLKRTMGKKILVFTDSMVSALSLDKGRSRSHALNSVCRRVCGLLLGHGIRVRYRHIPTDRNVADEGSRRIDGDVVGKKVVEAQSRGAKKRTLRLEVLVPPPGLTATSSCHETDELLPEDSPSVMRPCHGGAAIAAPRDRSRRTSYPERRRVVRDLDQIPDEKMASSVFSSRRRVQLRPGAACLELFSGTGRLSKALRKAGLHVLRPVDILFDEAMDLASSVVQRRILEYIKCGRVAYVHLGTPCTIWSVARTRVANSAVNRKKERDGINFALFSATVVRLCSSMGIPWSMENPKSSRIWHFEPVATLFALPGAFAADLDMCAFGSVYKKPTRILTDVQNLSKLCQCCPRNHKHVLACGFKAVKSPQGTKYINHTAIAGEYPLQLCRLWAQGVARAVLPQARVARGLSFDDDGFSRIFER